MITHRGERRQTQENEWVAFPGGELEGRRPRVTCAACQERPERAATSHFLCFVCCRADWERENVLPFEPVNRARLEALRAERATARAALRTGSGRFADRRRQAQIAARHALQLVDRQLAPSVPAAVRERLIAAVFQAAELQLPEAWLPFVVGR